ncbi:hypothetical protein L9F63_014873, partial [Diploptera punctata]
LRAACKYTSLYSNYFQSPSSFSGTHLRLRPANNTLNSLQQDTRQGFKLHRLPSVPIG